MNWGNEVHGPVYPVGNVHLPYYEDVTENFVDRGLEPEDSHLVTVGSDLIGWWLKGQFPEAEVTTVEVNPRTAYMQNFAGDYLSQEDGSVEELKGFLGIDKPGTGIPAFVEDGETPEEVLEAHEDYVEKEASSFDEVPDFSEIGFAWKDFYPEILDEIGFETARPDSQIVGDFRHEAIPEADAMYTNNVVDTVGKKDFYSAVRDTLADDGYLEATSEPSSYENKEAFDPSLGLEADVNPDVDFWWRPSPEEEREAPGYRPTVVLYSPEA